MFITVILLLIALALCFGWYLTIKKYPKMLLDQLWVFALFLAHAIIYCFVYRHIRHVPSGDIMSQADLANLIWLDGSLQSVFPLGPSFEFRINYSPGFPSFVASILNLTGITINSSLQFFWFLSFYLVGVFAYDFVLERFQNRKAASVASFLMYTIPITSAYHSYGMPQKLLALLAVTMSLRIFMEFLKSRWKTSILAGASFASALYLHGLFIFFGACSWLGVFLVSLFQRSLLKDGLRFLPGFAGTVAILVIPYALNLNLGAAASGAGGGLDHVVYDLIGTLRTFLSSFGVISIGLGAIFLAVGRTNWGFVVLGNLFGLVLLSNNYRFYKILGLPWYREWVGEKHHNNIPTNVYYHEGLLPFFTHHILVMNGFNLLFIMLASAVIGSLFSKSKNLSEHLFKKVLLISFFFLMVKSSLIFFRGEFVGDAETLMGTKEEQVMGFLSESLKEKDVLWISGNGLFSWWLNSFLHIRTTYSRSLPSAWNMTPRIPFDVKQEISKLQRVYQGGLSDQEVVDLARKYNIKFVYFDFRFDQEPVKNLGVLKPVFAVNPYAVYKIADQ